MFPTSQTASQAARFDWGWCAVETSDVKNKLHAASPWASAML